MKKITIDGVATFIATGFGAGFIPKAPGTMGSLVAIPILFLISPLVIGVKFIFWIAVTIIGTWACHRFCKIHGPHDHQQIVIDEIIGMGFAGLLFYPRWMDAVVVFIFFRIFDITKIPPARQVDRWSKKSTGTKLAFGIIADDIIAGFQALIVYYLFVHFGLL